MSSSILISGGAGFLGSHLCDYYVRQGDEVVCVDNLCTGSMANIKHLQDQPNFIFINADIIKPLKKDIVHRKYQTVINLASPASPPHYQRLAIETLLTGSTGTFNLLEIARKNKARFFHASTSEVYGDPSVHPQPEEYRGNVNCYGPRSMYDESKRFGESLIYSYRRKYKVSTVIARFFNTYGPRMDPKDGRVVSNLIVQALQRRPLTIYGDGMQTRSFCYVDDLIRGIVALVASDIEGPINLGNPSEFTILELAQLIIELTGSTSKIVHKPLPADDPLQRKPVIDIAERTLNWKPIITLPEGLKDTIKYFADNINAKPRN